MVELTQPSLTYHTESLSSLTGEHLLFDEAPCTCRTCTTRASRSPKIITTSKPELWNRQSAMVFADFNVFESPSASRRDSTISSFNYLENRWSNSTWASSNYVLEKNLPEPFHVFSLKKKTQLVYIVSIASLFSPLSSNIYFPALGEISRELGISISLASLSITIYIIIQGLAPTFWGPLSDTKGRRITFVVTILLYLVANIGLVFTHDYTSLMVFRALQSAGSASTISVAAGVIGDITTAGERGSLIGVFGGIRMLGQSLGPVFGGVITQYLGFRAIFWFLFIIGTIGLLLILILVPETLRSIAGNGTIKLTSIYRPWIYLLFPPTHETQVFIPGPTKKIKISSIFSPLKLLAEKDIFVTLSFGAVVYTVFTAVTATTASLFQIPFSLTNLQVGLIFLPNGLGCVFGSYSTGYIMDYDYRLFESRYRQTLALSSYVQLSPTQLAEFPITRCRLRNIWWMVIIFILATTLYGFSIKLGILAVPLMLQFFIAYSATAVYSLNSALVIDLFPSKSASVTSVANLVRYAGAAGGVAIIEIIIENIGAGQTFLWMGVMTAGLCPLVWIEWVYGERWRRERGAREERRDYDRVDREKN